ncbi:MAG: tetratricopeptide repeat protein, partial [Acidimicrobiales bacterium]
MVRAQICLEFGQYEHAIGVIGPALAAGDPFAAVLHGLASRLLIHQRRREPADWDTFRIWVQEIETYLGHGSPEHLLMEIRAARREYLGGGVAPLPAYETVSELIGSAKEQLHVQNRLKRPDRVLGLSTMEVELDYQRIALELDHRQYRTAYEHIERFAERHGDLVHGALWVATARTRRALGLRRVGRIDELTTRIGRLEQEAFDATANGRPVRFTQSRYLASLFRHLAVAHAATKPKAAMAAIRCADRHRSIEYGVPAPPEAEPPVHSYARPLYALMLNDRAQALDLAAQLLETRGLPGLAAELRRFTGPDAAATPEPGSEAVSPEAREALSTLDEAHIRAVLAVVRVLRTVGHGGPAWHWLDLLPADHPSAALCDAHRISLEREMGSASGRIEGFDPAAEPLTSQAPTAEHDTVELLWSELGRSALAVADLDKAEQIYTQLSGSPWFDSEVDGRAGLVDIKRRRRMLPAVRGDVSGYLNQYRSAGVDPPADLEAAGAWAELQIGDPRRAAATLQGALRREPYSVTAWIGLVRSLRLLGCPRDAHLVCRLVCGGDGHLTGQVQLDELRAWLDDRPPPSLDVRHGGLLESEAGWCAIDASAWADAHDHFTRSLAVMPYFVSAHRGIVAATTGDSARDLDELIAAQLDYAARRLPDPVRRDGPALGLLELELHLEAGAVRAAQHLPEPAQRHLARAAELSLTTPGSDRHRTDRTIASIHIDLGDLDEAVRVVPWLRNRTEPTADDRQQILIARYGIRDHRPPNVSVERVDEFHDAASRTSTPGSDPPPAIVRWGLGDEEPLVPGSARWLTAVICLFETRRFLETERALDAAMTPLATRPRPGVGQEQGPDPVPNRTLAVLRAWVALARSELPYVPTEEQKRLIFTACDITSRLEGWTVEDLHLSAIA